MRDLDEQLRRYVDSVAPVIRPDELRDGSQRIRRLVPALAGAVVVLVAVALVIVPGLHQSPTGTTASQRFVDSLLANATVVHEDPIIYQPQLGSAPAFDTSGLGTEVTLHAASSTGTDLDATMQLLTSDRDTTPASAPWEGPILHIGSLDDGTRLLLNFVSDRDYFWAITSGSEFAEGAGTLDRYGELGSFSPGGTYVAVRVPLETSVVVFQLDDGTTLWQRPAVGHGLFPIMRYGELPPGTITALDTTGATIGQWPFDR